MVVGIEVGKVVSGMAGIICTEGLGDGARTIVCWGGGMAGICTDGLGDGAYAIDC